MKNLYFVMFILLLLPQQALCGDSLRTISVSGKSTITLEADYAKIHGQLKVVSTSVEESYGAVTANILEISNQLQQFGVTRDDIVASVITQGPEYEWRDNMQVLKGYYSACALQIKVNEIKDTFRIHSALSQFTTLAIGNTEYGRKDEYTLQATALKAALKSAEAKARMMAQTLNTELGQVISIREESSMDVPAGRPEMMFATRAEDVSDVTTIGTIAVTGEVSVDFELK
jgi:uncharacterized protein YggE